MRKKIFIGTAVMTIVLCTSWYVLRQAPAPLSTSSVEKAAMADSDNSHKLLARKDRGIHTPADCKGKAIGVTKGASGQFFLDVFLLSHGLNPAEVETIDLALYCRPDAHG